MQIGTILHVDSCGIVAVQLLNRVVRAQILVGGGQCGDHVEGYMQPGLCSWLNTAHQRMVVDVLRA
jgi:hypothetical protein